VHSTQVRTKRRKVCLACQKEMLWITRLVEFYKLQFNHTCGIARLWAQGLPSPERSRQAYQAMLRANCPLT
jgi:hypothetical protein